MTSSSLTSLDAAFWDTNYQTQNTGWDLGVVSPPLSSYIDQLEDKSISILIPGCGNAYEVEYLLNAGFSNVTVIDISSVLTERLKEKLQPSVGKELKVLTGDFFEHTGQYNLIIEQTFLCALDPELRINYAKKMIALLAPGGKLTGLLFNRTFEQPGPPFGGDKKEYEALFSSNVRIKKWKRVITLLNQEQVSNYSFK